MSHNKALLIGINYFGTSSQLNGCINDVYNVRKYLGERFVVVNEVRLDGAKSGTQPKLLGIVQSMRLKFQNKVMSTADFDAHSTSMSVADQHKAKTEEVSVLILTDDQAGAHKPTRENILHAIDWLVKDTKPGEKRFFHYSGHGSQQRDTNGDEADGKDECICPCDYMTAGMISDDALRSRLVDALPAGAHLAMIVDACHSASSADLTYCYKCDKPIFAKTAQFKAETDKQHKETKARVTCWSGCMDNQTSADAYMGGAYAGALTACFLTILRDPAQDLTYESVFTKLTESLAQKRFTQKPQLSSGHLIEEGERFEIF